jgi:hypothetical protein
MKNATRFAVWSSGVLLALTVLVTPSEAQAERICHPGRVYPAEYDQLQPGSTTFAETKAIVGGAGKPMDDPAVWPSGWMERTWNTCPYGGWAYMRFQKAFQGQPRADMVLEWKRASWE